MSFALPSLGGLFGFFSRRRGTGAARDLLESDAERLANYTRFYKAYQGWTLREYLYSTNRDTVYLDASYKRLKFNFNRPVVNLGASFLAAIPLDWEVKEYPEATAACYKIWARSDSLLKAARTAGIYGDIVALATENEEGPKIEFVDPNICFPVFGGRDYDRVTELDISFSEESRDGRQVVHREFYTENGLTVFEDDAVVREQAYDEIPLAWICNLSIEGQPFGESDISPIIDLVDEYDHVCQKRTRTIDYYAEPNIVCKGVQASNLLKKTGTIYFLPADGDMSFIEWKGSQPDVEKHLTRIRNGIAEIAQVPAVAFGQADTGLTSISGVAIRILYGPIILKTTDKQGNWEPGLRRVMRLCLRAAGFDVPRDDINIVWPENIPVSGMETVAEESAAVAAELRSKRTSMNNLGVEDPDAELKRILIEKAMDQILLAQADPIKVASAAMKGNAVAPGRAFGAKNVAAAAQKPGGGGASVPSAPASIVEMLAQFDEIVSAEDASIEKAG